MHIHFHSEHRLLARQSFEKGPEGLPQLPEFGNFSKIMHDFEKRMKDVWQTQSPETRREVTNVGRGLSDSIHGIVSRFVAGIHDFTPNLRPNVERLGGRFGMRNAAGIEWDDEDDVLHFDGHEFDFPVEHGHYATVRIEHGDGTVGIYELHAHDEDEDGVSIPMEGSNSFVIDSQGEEHVVDDEQMARIIALEQQQHQAELEREQNERLALLEQMGAGRPPRTELPEQPNQTEPAPVRPTPTPPQRQPASDSIVADRNLDDIFGPLPDDGVQRIDNDRF
ncbi:hypothetical protein HY213_03500 [Candidatus Peregrinibacteria bacterium]|nr:hypothetical protein [Candidatus Peregrinibacteria bacterium]